jgi:hypothetical protein
VDAFIWTLGIAELIFGVAYVLTLFDTIQHRRWGWLVGVVLAVVLVNTFDPFYRSALLAVAVTGCLICLVGPARAKGWGRNVSIALMALMAVYSAVGSMLFQFTGLRNPLLGAGTGVEYLLPLLIYGLWSGPAKPRTQPVYVGASRQTILTIATIYLGLVALLALPYLALITSPRGRSSSNLVPVGILSGGSLPPLTLGNVAVAAALLIGVVMLVSSLVDAGRSRQWGWLAGIPLVFASMAAWTVTLLQLGITSVVPDGGIALSFLFVAPALIYALWAGPSTHKPAQSATGKL